MKTVALGKSGIDASTKKHLQENLDAVTVALTADQMTTLNDAGV